MHRSKASVGIRGAEWRHRGWRCNHCWCRWKDYDAIDFDQIGESTQDGQTMLAGIQEESDGRLGYSLKSSDVFHKIAEMGAQRTDMTRACPPKYTTSADRNSLKRCLPKCALAAWPITPHNACPTTLSSIGRPTGGDRSRCYDSSMVLICFNSSTVRMFSLTRGMKARSASMGASATPITSIWFSATRFCVVNSW